MSGGPVDSSAYPPVTHVINRLGGRLKKAPLRGPDLQQKNDEEAPPHRDDNVEVPSHIDSNEDMPPLIDDNEKITPPIDDGSMSGQNAGSKGQHSMTEEGAHLDYHEKVPPPTDDGSMSGQNAGSNGQHSKTEEGAHINPFVKDQIDAFNETDPSFVLLHQSVHCFAQLLRHPFENTIYVVASLAIMTHAYLPVAFPDLARIIKEGRQRNWSEEYSILLNLVTYFVCGCCLFILMLPRRKSWLLKCEAMLLDALLILVLFGAGARACFFITEWEVLLYFLVLIIAVVVLSGLMAARYRYDRGMKLLCGAPPLPKIIANLRPPLPIINTNRRPFPN